MSASHLKAYLDQNQIKYTTINHAPSYTAQEIAATAHVSGKSMAKTVIVKLDGKMAMVVEPANAKVDFNTLKMRTKANDIELASESEFQDRFPECELGAMPPFGNLYDMDVYVSETLMDNDTIIFNAGNHSELIQMSLNDFTDMVRPTVLKLAA